jgi:hypothetical protein
MYEPYESKPTVREGEEFIHVYELQGQEGRLQTEEQWFEELKDEYQLTEMELEEFHITQWRQALKFKTYTLIK